MVPLILGALGSAGWIGFKVVALAVRTAAPSAIARIVRITIALPDLTFASFDRPTKADRYLSNLAPRGRQASLLEPLREGVMLLAHRRRKVIPEPVEELLLAAQRVAPAVDVDLEELLALCRSESRPLEIERAARGNHPDGRFHSVRLAPAAGDDPLQDAQVLAEAGPEELSVSAAQEPVHAEDARGLGELRAHFEPVPEVVAHVVAAERQHGEGVASQD